MFWHSHREAAGRDGLWQGKAQSWKLAPDPIPNEGQTMGRRLLRMRKARRKPAHSSSAERCRGTQAGRDMANLRTKLVFSFKCTHSVLDSNNHLPGNAQHSPSQLATRCSPCSSSNTRETEPCSQRLCQELPGKQSPLVGKEYTPA